MLAACSVFSEKFIVLSRNRTRTDVSARRIPVNGYRQQMQLEPQNQSYHILESGEQASAIANPAANRTPTCAVANN